jgi:hypothetical protein
MTGATAAVASAGGDPNLIGWSIGQITDQNIGAGAICSVTLNTNGTQTKQGNTAVASANWYLPTTTSIGNGYWWRAVVISGSAPNIGSANVIAQLNANRQIGYSVAPNGRLTGTIKIQLAKDAGMGLIVAERTFLMDAFG